MKNQILNKIKEWVRAFLFDDMKIKLAFEYGVVLAKVAQENGVEITPELMEKAEQMIVGEFEIQSSTRLAVDMTMNIISVFELDVTK